jgi:hypothetical protein
MLIGAQVAIWRVKEVIAKAMKVVQWRLSQTLAKSTLVHICFDDVDGGFRIDE